MRLSRRAFLSRSAAAVAATGAVGCKPTRARAIEGRIVGASHDVGHRLREARAGGAPAATRDVPVVIAGGGVAGLAAAWRLDRAGYRSFQVCELEPSVGGNARWGETPVSRHPWGAHYLPMPPPEARAVRAFLEEAGVITGADASGAPIYDEAALCQAPHARLFLHGRWQDGIFPRDAIPTWEAREARRFREHVAALRRAPRADGRRAFALPMAASSADDELRALDAISMRAWLDGQGYRSPRLRWWIDYSLRDDYGCTAETTSAWAAFHYFCARGEDDPAVLTWPEGNGFLVEKLAARAAGRVRTGALVTRVRPRADGADVDVMDVATGRAERLRAAHVIYALPRFTAPYVVEGAPRAHGFTYAPWVVANVTVDRAPEGAAWDNVVHDSPSLGYIVATHQSLRVRPGPSVLTWYRPFTGADPAAERAALLARPWASFRDEVLADLARAHPEVEATVSRVDVMVWGHAMIRPTPGFVFGEARRAALASVGRVRFAHSDMSGLSLFEEAHYRGVAAAEDVLASLGHETESLL